VRNAEWKQLHDIVVVSASALFRSYDIPASYMGTVPYCPAAWADQVAIVELGGGKLRGSLVLCIPTSLLIKSHPMGGTEQADLVDWLGELSNLLLGRVKNRLLAHGITVELSSPVTISTSDARFEFSAPPVVYEFWTGDVPMHVMFEAIAEHGARLDVGPGLGVLDPGGVVTF
jgi:CheY-specific phosphatase CheX